VPNPWRPPDAGPPAPFAASTPQPAHGFADGLVDGYIVQALQDAMSEQLLGAANRSPSVKDMVNTHGAHMEAIERYLGVAVGTLNRVDTRTVTSWIAALSRANAPVGR